MIAAIDEQNARLTAMCSAVSVYSIVCLCHMVVVRMAVSYRSARQWNVAVHAGQAMSVHRSIYNYLYVFFFLLSIACLHCI